MLIPPIQATMAKGLLQSASGDSIMIVVFLDDIARPSVERILIPFHDEHI